MKKRLLALAMASLLAVGSAGATSLIVDGKTVQSDVPPVITDGRTLVPVRALFESLGATVGWDDATQTATATKGGTVISMQIGSQTAYVNGAATSLDVPAQTVDGRTMVPARFVAESLGAQVEWDAANDQVKITTGAQPAKAPTQNTSVSAPADGESRTVYITKTGKRYHYDSNCNGGTYIASTLAEAQARGLTPCQKCVQ